MKYYKVDLGILFSMPNKTPEPYEERLQKVIKHAIQDKIDRLTPEVASQVAKRISREEFESYL